MRAPRLDGAARTPDVELEEVGASISTLPRRLKQQSDADGCRLSERRHEVIEGAPTLATSSVWRWWLA